MIAKTITYEDYNGNTRTEEFHFNLNKAELLDMQTSIPGGLENKIKEAVAAQDTHEIMEILKMWVTKSYGVKSPDGKRFNKSQELTDAFVQSEAYSELIMELVTNTDMATAFINGVVPAAIQKEANKQAMLNG